MFKIIMQSLSTSIITMLLTFVSSILIARALGPELRGEWASVTLYMTVISTISLLGLGDSYIFHKRKYLGKINDFYMIISAMLTSTIVAMLLYTLTKNYINFRNIDYILFFLLLMVFANLLISICRVDSDLVVFNKSKVILSSVNLIIITICYLFLDITISSLIFIMMFSLFFQIIYVFKSTIASLFFNEPSNQKEFKLYDFYFYGLKIHLTIILGVIINNFDKIYMYFYATSEHFGIYAVSFGFSRLIGVLPNTFSSVLYAKFAGEKESSVSEITSLVFSFLFMPLMFLTIAVSILSAYFIPLLYGEEYKSAVVPTCVLLFECVLSGLGWILAQRFNAVGKPGVVFFRQLIAILPFIYLIIYSVDGDIAIILSLTMLLASIIRLLITVFMYKTVLGESMPRVFPEKKDIYKLYYKYMR